MLVELVCQALPVSTSGDGEVSSGISTVRCDDGNDLGLSLVSGSLLLTVVEANDVLSSRIGSSIFSKPGFSAFA